MARTDFLTKSTSTSVAYSFNSDSTWGRKREEGVEREKEEEQEEERGEERKEERVEREEEREEKREEEREEEREKPPRRDGEERRGRRRPRATSLLTCAMLAWLVRRIMMSNFSSLM